VDRQSRRATPHRHGDRDHGEGKEKQELLAIDDFSNRRLGRGADDSGRRESRSKCPFDVADPPMAEEIGESIGATASALVPMATWASPMPTT
jgi:hypothetical protein